VIILIFFLSFFLTAGPLRAQDERHYFEAGIEFINQGEIPLAIESFRKAIRANPNIPQFHNALGVALLKTEEGIIGAMNAFMTATELNPHYGDPYFNIGTYYAGVAKDPILAKEFFEKSIEADPNFAKGYTGLGWLELQKQNGYDAVQYFEKAVKRDPDVVEAQYGLGLAYVAAEKRGAALKSITLLRQIGRDDLARRIEDIMKTPEKSESDTTQGGAGFEFF